MGVHLHYNLEFLDILEPEENDGLGWHAAVNPKDHPVNKFEFNFVVGKYFVYYLSKGTIDHIWWVSIKHTV